MKVFTLVALAALTANGTYVSFFGRNRTTQPEQKATVSSKPPPEESVQPVETQVEHPNDAGPSRASAQQSPAERQPLATRKGLLLTIIQARLLSGKSQARDVIKATQLLKGVGIEDLQDLFHQWILDGPNDVVNRHINAKSEDPKSAETLEAFQDVVKKSVEELFKGKHRWRDPEVIADAIREVRLAEGKVSEDMNETALQRPQRQLEIFAKTKETLEFFQQLVVKLSNLQISSLRAHDKAEVIRNALESIGQFWSRLTKSDEVSDGIHDTLRDIFDHLPQAPERRIDIVMDKLASVDAAEVQSVEGITEFVNTLKVSWDAFQDNYLDELPSEDGNSLQYLHDALRVRKIRAFLQLLEPYTTSDQSAFKETLKTIDLIENNILPNMKNPVSQNPFIAKPTEYPFVGKPIEGLWDMSYTQITEMEFRQKLEMAWTKFEDDFKNVVERSKPSNQVYQSVYHVDLEGEHQPSRADMRNWFREKQDRKLAQEVQEINTAIRAAQENIANKPPPTQNRFRALRKAVGRKFRALWRYLGRRS